MKNNVQVMQVAPMLIPAVRSSVERLFRGKRFPGLMLVTLDQMLRKAMIGEMQLWIAYEEGEEPFLCMFTELINHPVARVLHIHPLAGSGLRRVFDKLPDFEAWALMQGAHYIDFSTRPGLVRLLKRYGFIPTSISVHKPLIAIH